LTIKSEKERDFQSVLKINGSGRLIVKKGNFHFFLKDTLPADNEETSHLCHDEIGVLEVIYSQEGNSHYY
jgi:hypothetical protein